ncbi:MAG: hypothetical protein O3B73_14740 [bacterium]|nr:hypothetical protein [bacterium]
MSRFLGITVLADFVISEGIESVLKNLEKVGATAVATNPTVSTEAAPGQGSFQPPTDAGSSPRLFDRPLFGKKSLWVKTAPSYHPDIRLYRDTSYKPRKANELTITHGHIIGDFIKAALARGFKVYLQVNGATPSDLMTDDIPRLPNGEIPDNRMANTGSLASPSIRSYNRAYVKDLLKKYPDITGFRPDWPEYPCYKLDEAFQDFGMHVKPWAEARGFAYGEIKREVGAFYTYLHGSLTNKDLVDWAGVDRGKLSQIRLLRQHPAVLEWLRLKAALSTDLLRDWRSAITEAGGAEKELSANAFMVPLTLFTGFDFSAASAHCDAISPKLYTMHWSAMVEFWGRALLSRNAGLDESLVTRALANLFDLGDAATADKLSEFGYPEPDEPHPIPNEPQVRKIRQVVDEVNGRCDVTALMHGYGPLKDFARRFQIVADSDATGIWINRYGYLSDDKLDTLRDIWKT